MKAHIVTLALATSAALLAIVVVPDPSRPWEYALWFGVFWLAFYPAARRSYLKRYNVSVKRYCIGGIGGCAIVAVIGAIWKPRT